MSELWDSYQRHLSSLIYDAKMGPSVLFVSGLINCPRAWQYRAVRK